MKNYLVIYHAPAEALAASAEQTPEEMEKGMEPWMAWAAQCGDQLVDLGQPLIGGQRLNTDGSSNPSDREVCGYSMLKANSMDEAKTLLQGHPHLAWTAGCEIEVHETMPIPGM